MRIAWLVRTNYCVLGVPWQWLLPLAAALFFLLAPLAAFAQKTPKAANGPGTSLKGTVTTQNGDVLAGATVKLAKNPPIGVPATAETDENGHYEFHNLQSGNYSISVAGRGLQKNRKSSAPERRRAERSGFQSRCRDRRGNRAGDRNGDDHLHRELLRPGFRCHQHAVGHAAHSAGTSEGSDSRNSGRGADARQQTRIQRLGRESEPADH